MRKFLYGAVVAVVVSQCAFAQSDPVGEAASLKAPETGFQSADPMGAAMPVSLHRAFPRDDMSRQSLIRGSDARWTSNDNAG